MATQVGGLIRNEASVGGKANNVSKTQKKGGLGGRKPLGEISNSVKPSLNQALKKQISMDFSYLKEENDASIVGKKGFSKPKEKVQVGVRKPLGDISNSKAQSLHHHHHRHAPKKSLGENLNALMEEPLYSSDIAEEGFLHNHHECIKAQRRAKAMDIDYFLETIGQDNGSSLKLASPTKSHLPMMLKHESPMKLLEVDEMSVLLSEDGSLLGEHASSPPIKSPVSPKIDWNWEDDKVVDFMLMESPKLPKY